LEGTAIRNSGVSVIVPVYNAALSLPRCLDSIISQDPRPAEVIVINDGSTDGTAAVAESYIPMIRYIEQENRGQGAARNAGLKQASGEFIAFLDADDYWLPGFTDTTTAFLREHPEPIAVSVGQVIKLWGRKDRIRPALLQTPDAPRQPMVLDDFFGFWARHDHIRTGSNIIRHAAIQQAGFQREDLRISQDLEYWGYMATFGKWGFIPEIFFVSDGAAAASVHGWTAKYAKRRRLCPTVEQWEARIAPRLHESQWPAFRMVRARVAASFAHSRILAGDDAAASHIVGKHGAEFAHNWKNKTLCAGARGGILGWKIVCNLLRLREGTKSRLMVLTESLKNSPGQVMRKTNPS